MKENYYKAISVQQPWAWAIIHGGKDVENRTWKTNYRGPLLIHAGKTFDWQEYQWIMGRKNYFSLKKKLPQPYEFFKGGFIGAVNIIACVENFSSRWFFGPFGFVLESPIIFGPPIPYPGKLKIFTVPETIIGKGLLRALPKYPSTKHI